MKMASKVRSQMEKLFDIYKELISNGGEAKLILETRGSKSFATLTITEDSGRPEPKAKPQKTPSQVKRSKLWMESFIMKKELEKESETSVTETSGVQDISEPTEGTIFKCDQCDSKLTS